MPPRLGFESLNEALLLETGKASEHRSRPDGHPGEVLNVLHQCVAVFRPARERGEDQEGRIRFGEEPTTAHITS